MTAEEAREHLIYLSDTVVVSLDDVVDESRTERHQEAIRIAIEALEKQEKYRWHDLRKNPEDLPEEDAEIAVTWVNHEPVSYYANIKDKPFTGFAVYHKGEFWWWSCVCSDYLAEYDRSPGDGMDEHIEVIAWREIEPFEEEV